MWRLPGSHKPQGAPRSQPRSLSANSDPRCPKAELPGTIVDIEYVYICILNYYIYIDKTHTYTCISIIDLKYGSLIWALIVVFPDYAEWKVWPSLACGIQRYIWIY